MPIPPDPPSTLLTPGERLGWVFRDRNIFRRRFLHPPPVRQDVPAAVSTRARRTTQALGRHITLAIAATLVAVTVLGCCGGAFAASSGDSGRLVGGVLAGLGLVAGAGVVGFLVYNNADAKAAVTRVGDAHRAEYDQQLADWQAAKQTFDSAEAARCDGLVEWGAARLGAGTQRLDVVGGSLWGWEGFLTVFGSSALGTRGPLTVVDLSGEAVCRELVQLVGARGLVTDVQVLPHDLETTGLLAGLDARQLVDVLVESLHGDSDSTDRAARAMDDRILSSVCAALGTDLSMGRLAAALRLLMGEPGESALLTDDERRAIADDLFSAEYRRQAHPQLRRMESFVHPLERLGTGPGAGAGRGRADLTCLAVVSDGRSARSELLDDLVVQWLMRRVSAEPEAVPTLVVAGADELQRRQVERLSDICERRGVRLVLLFRHLRDASLQVLGSGAVAFMRLGNSEEATRAADFVGRQHTFVLSQLTRSLGGNETHTRTEGESTEQGVSGDRLGRLVPLARQWSRSRSWSRTQAFAAGTSWSDAVSQQRVYEYAVEPRTLQDLPDYAMLLVEPRASGPLLKAVECNPDIVTLPRVSLQELPDLPLPEHPEVPARLPVQQLATSGFRPDRGRGGAVPPPGPVLPHRDQPLPPQLRRPGPPR